jgi:DNA repair protein RadD
VQTAMRRSFSIKPWLIIIDECHLAVANTYKQVLAAAGNPPILGLTGTPCRLDGRGLGEMFDRIIPTCSTADLIGDGMLSPIKYFAPSKPELSGIRTRAGDYALEQLQEAVDKASITGDAVQHYRKMCSGRPAVAFCVSISHAEHVAAQFAAAGYRAVSVSGKSTKEERKQALEGLRAGKLDVVCNAQLWVAGVDVPNIECIILLRPTKSLTFYLQAIGRGLRLAPGKTHCTVLDHAGCVFEHGPPQIAREWTLDAKKKRKKKEDIPAIKQCPMCFGVHEPAPVCPLCGHVYTTVQRRGPEQIDGELVEFTAPEAWHPAPGDKVLCEVTKEIWYFVKNIDSSTCMLSKYPEIEDTEFLLQKYGNDCLKITFIGMYKVLKTASAGQILKAQKKQEQAAAKSLSELEAIARQRGYKPGWAKRVMAAREAKRAAASGILR